MKHLFLSGLVALAFIVSACEQQSNLTAPVDTQAPVVLDDQLLGISDFDNSILGDDPTGDRKIDPRRIGDAGAMAWVRLLLAANPEMDDATKTALKEAITASNQRRLEIIRDTTLTPEEKKAALDAEHLALMEKINGSAVAPGIVTPEQIANAQALKEKLEQERKERMDKMIEARIDYQIKVWTRMLKLDTEVQGKIKEILMAQQKRIAELRVEFANDPAGLRKALAGLQQETDAAIRALLTPEQAAIWDKMHGKRDPGKGGGRGGVIGTRG
ncbi:MAG: hypothetical protein HY962_00715 [Ignavibacteriae bacterium]|nr:hypothetical protein [Ignavibacteriota bacterium]